MVERTQVTTTPQDFNTQLVPVNSQSVTMVFEEFKEIMAMQVPTDSHLKIDMSLISLQNRLCLTEDKLDSKCKAYELTELQRDYLNKCGRLVKKLVRQLKECKLVSNTILDQIFKLTKKVREQLDIKAAGVNMKMIKPDI